MAKQANTFMDFDMGRLMGDFKAPTLNMEHIADTYRKNVEAVTKANQVAMEGMQAVVRRQIEIGQQNMEQAMSFAGTAMSTGTSEDRFAASADIAKNQYERTVSQVKELGEIVNKSNGEAFSVLHNRVTGMLEEAKSASKAN